MPGAAVASRSAAGATASDALLAAGALAIGTAALLDPGAVEHGPVVCPVRLLTGLECPGCGSVRAWVAAMHGDVAVALSHNPFAVGLLVATAALVTWTAVAAVRGTRRPDVLALLASPPALVLVAAWVAWAVARVAT